MRDLGILLYQLLISGKIDQDDTNVDKLVDFKDSSPDPVPADTS